MLATYRYIALPTLCKSDPYPTLYHALRLSNILSVESVILPHFIVQPNLGNGLEVNHMHFTFLSHFFLSLLIVISGCELLEGGAEECEGGEGGDKCEGGEGTERRLRVLERVLKTLENVRFKFIYYRVQWNGHS